MALPPQIAERLRKAEEARRAVEASTDQPSTALTSASLGPDSDDSDTEEAAVGSTSLDPALLSGTQPGAAPGGPQQQQQKPKDWDKFIQIYPCYIDPTFPLRKGRRISKTKCAGCERAGVKEIAQAIAMAGFQTLVGLEPQKRHPADPFRPGRLRVRLVQEDGSLVNEAFPSRKILLEKVAAVIGGHEGRSEIVSQQYAKQMQQLDDVLAKGSMAMHKEMEQQYQQRALAARQAAATGGGGGARGGAQGAIADGAADGSAQVTSSAPGSTPTASSSRGGRSRRGRRRRK